MRGTVPPWAPHHRRTRSATLNSIEVDAATARDLGARTRETSASIAWPTAVVAAQLLAGEELSTYLLRYTH